MPDVIQEWDAEEVICEAFWGILLAFWHPKLAKSGLKHAPLRRGYTRSLPMGSIDGTNGGAFIRAFPNISERYGCARMRQGCVLDTSTDGFEGFPPLKPPLVGSTRCPQKMVFLVRPAAYISSHACVKRGFRCQVGPNVPRGWGWYSMLLGIRAAAG
eukprot:gene16135-biopygen21770